MKIIVNNDDKVDLNAPIHMTEDQKERFVDFFRENFYDDVETIEVHEPIVDVDKSDVEIKKWTPSHIHTLLNTDDNHEAAQKLDRKDWSVAMARAKYEPKIMKWAKERGYAVKDITEGKIKQALKDIKKGENDDPNT